MDIIGRIAQQEELAKYLESDKSEFVTVYGRRRVGKTFLIREYFKNRFAFYVTGLANENLQNQLRNFHTALQSHGSVADTAPNNWLDAFGELKNLLENSRQRGRKVIFLDELPWMDTPRSGFISALEHFWNSWASARSDIMLIVCGSATSWMINNLIKNRGGLHNRVTRRMYIEPFTLGECEAYYKVGGIVMSRYQMLESYMVLGGVPYYLSLLDKSKSLAQNVDALCFSPNGSLREEFGSLYASLFRHAESHIKIVEALGKKTKGLTREEIIAVTKLPPGGNLSKTLEELEQCGFIRSYYAFGKKERDKLFQLVDFFSLFYLNFIRDNKYNDEHFWTNSIENARHRAWSGYAFEQVCLAHIRQIKDRLGIAGVLTNVASWRSQRTEVGSGAQIDLLIDRSDNVINLCEMKYSVAEFVIDKKYDEALRGKKAAFIRETNTRKAIHQTMVTTYGVKRNEYSGQIQSEVRMDDLFKA